MVFTRFEVATSHVVINVWVEPNITLSKIKAEPPLLSILNFSLFWVYLNKPQARIMPYCNFISMPAGGRKCL